MEKKKSIDKGWRVDIPYLMCCRLNIEGGRIDKAEWVRLSMMLSLRTPQNCASSIRPCPPRSHSPSCPSLTGGVHSTIGVDRCHLAPPVLVICFVSNGVSVFLHNQIILSTCRTEWNMSSKMLLQPRLHRIRLMRPSGQAVLVSEALSRWLVCHRFFFCLRARTLI